MSNDHLAVKPIPLFKVFIAPDAIDGVRDVFESGMVAQGPVVEQYESALKTFFDPDDPSRVKLLTVNSATSGLTLALRLLDLPSNSPVLTSPLTCTATNWPILANGLVPKWVDVDPETCNMDLNDLESKLSSTTRVVILVHWGGHPVDMDRVGDIVERYREKYGRTLHIIEDCAHAFGAKYKSQYIGHIRRWGAAHTHVTSVCVFSTQAIKHLTTIDGGFMTFPNGSDMYDRAKRLRWFGIDREARIAPNGDFRVEPDIPEWGYKFNMNDVNAAIGVANLRHMPCNLEYASQLANFYNEALTDVHGVQLIRTENAQPCYWLYTLRIVRRDAFIEYMKDGPTKVMCSRVHTRNDTHTCVRNYADVLPGVDQLERDMVSIPCGWWVSMDQATYIVDRIKQWCSATTPVVRPLSGQTDDPKQFFNVLSQINGCQPYSYYVNTPGAFAGRVAELAGTGQHIYVAVADGKIVGTAKLVLEPKFFDPVGHIEDVVVDREYRCMGIGKMLVDALTQLASNVGCYKVVLNATMGEIEAFYTRNCNYRTHNTMTVVRMEHKK